MYPITIHGINRNRHRAPDGHAHPETKTARCLMIERLTPGEPTECWFGHSLPREIWDSVTTPTRSTMHLPLAGNPYILSRLRTIIGTNCGTLLSYTDQGGMMPRFELLKAGFIKAEFRVHLTLLDGRNLWSYDDFSVIDWLPAAGSDSVSVFFAHTRSLSAPIMTAEQRGDSVAVVCDLQTVPLEARQYTAEDLRRLGFHRHFHLGRTKQRPTALSGRT